jgi:multicomponent Na+:H+ antiporter subunit D
MIEWFHPGLIYIFGALLIPVFRGRLKKAYLLLLPTLAFINLLLMSSDVILSEGTTWFLPFLGYDLVLGRIDRVSMVFAYVFVIASFCMMFYALHIKEDGQHIAAYIMGSISLHTSMLAVPWG